MDYRFLSYLFVLACLSGVATGFGVLTWPWGLSIVPVDDAGQPLFSWLPVMLFWGAFFSLLWRIAPRTDWPVGPLAYVVSLVGLATGTAGSISLFLWWLFN